ncbi:unnamed protein product [Rangifer tarandus platyrhynchus]|uniref:Uncharacterized protein n=1 Tax=Rangifer tarandus platyrhynchus TaxID=3082113 RepID=A0AC59YJM2_RANTA
MLLLLFSGSVVADSFVTSWTVARQAPLSMGFSRHICWDRLPFPSSGDLPDPGIEPVSPALTGRFFTTEPPVTSLSPSNVHSLTIISKDSAHFSFLSFSTPLFKLY